MSKSLFALTAALAIAAAPLWAAPSVHVETHAIEFGTVAQGEPVTAEVAIGNMGDETLVIERMEFSVPGMTARLKQKIPPGETASIRLNLDTSRLRNAVEGRMTLFLNDPATPRTDIDLRGEVVPAIEFRPRPAFYFSQFTGERQTDTITLRNNRDAPLTIEGLRPSSEQFEYRLDTVEPGRAFEVIVTTLPDLPPGRYREHLRIDTSDPAYPQLHLEVNVLVKPDVFVSPETIDFGTVSRTELMTRSGAADFIRQPVVINRRHGSMRITGVTADLPALDLSVSPQGPSEGFMLTAGLHPEQLARGTFEGTIRIATDDAAHPELTIEVRGTITD